MKINDSVSYKTFLIKVKEKNTISRYGLRRSHSTTKTKTTKSIKKDQDIETKKENSFNSTPNQSLKCHISVFLFLFYTFCLSLSDNGVSSLKSGSKELKALARCVVSFWYSDLPAYTEHYDTFGWSHCGIRGLPCHFQQQYCDLGMLFLTLRLALTPGPKIYINLCLKMKERGWDNEVKLYKWEGRCVSVCVCVEGGGC